MYKILHLATGTYVMGNRGEDLYFNNKEEIIRHIFNSKYIVFIKARGEKNHCVEIASILGTELDGWKTIPKHEFEIIEVPDV
jgi:hypothetical protein